MVGVKKGKRNIEFKLRYLVTALNLMSFNYPLPILPSCHASVVYVHTAVVECNVNIIIAIPDLTLINLMFEYPTATLITYKYAAANDVIIFISRRKRNCYEKRTSGCQCIALLLNLLPLAN